MAVDLLERASVLGPDAAYDLCAPSGAGRASVTSPARGGAQRPALRPAGVPDRGAGRERRDRRPRSPRDWDWDDIRRSITRVQRPDGAMPVLRMMQTNVCTNDCYYCAFRSDRDVRRETFAPDELAKLTVQLHRAGLVRGLFLSSGIIGRGDASMERIVATAEILRSRYRYSGYVHLKLMPSASDDAIAAAIRVADRVSLNLEAPTAEHLARLTSTKNLTHDLVEPLRRARTVAAREGKPVSRTTQFVVGAAGETDADILCAAERLYRDAGVARAYFSTFNPVPDTPLDGLAPGDPVREHRLYQADFLLRQYGFSTADLPLDHQGRLPLGIDPKTAWAMAHPEAFPVEVMRAGREALLRVPGIGPKSVDAILRARRSTRVPSERDLRIAGADVTRARPWITISGRATPTQLRLPSLDAVEAGSVFPEPRSAATLRRT